jgi:hypothetical protein
VGAKSLTELNDFRETAHIRWNSLATQRLDDTWRTSPRKSSSFFPAKIQTVKARELQKKENKFEINPYFFKLYRRILTI